VSSAFNVLIKHPCDVTSFVTQTLENVYDIPQSFTHTLPKLADTVANCGDQSVTVTDASGNDVSSWVTPGVDGSGNPTLLINGVGKPAG
jgi:hypothetical protein